MKESGVKRNKALWMKIHLSTKRGAINENKNNDFI
jgi:hypothetical protein